MYRLFPLILAVAGGSAWAQCSINNVLNNYADCPDYVQGLFAYSAREYAGWGSVGRGKKPTEALVPARGSAKIRSVFSR